MSTGYKIFTVDINAGYTLYLFNGVRRHHGWSIRSNTSQTFSSFRRILLVSHLNAKQF